MNQNPNENPYLHSNQPQAGNTVGHPAPQQGNQGDATGGLIPYKNPPALIAYYISLLSLLPIVGIPFGISAFILGIIGLKKRAANPVIKGAAHAWIGIILGGGTTLLWILLTLSFLGFAVFSF
jgi:hypothetical protein